MAKEGSAWKHTDVGANRIQLPYGNRTEVSQVLVAFGLGPPQLLAKWVPYHGSLLHQASKEKSLPARWDLELCIRQSKDDILITFVIFHWFEGNHKSYLYSRGGDYTGT